jgi:hypothetical protein
LGFLELGVEITALSKRLEQGVKHLATVNLLEERRGCPVDRAKLDWLVDSFQKATSTQTKVLQMNQFLEWIRSNEEWLEEHRFTPFTRIRINTEDIGELKTFL